MTLQTLQNTLPTLTSYDFSGDDLVEVQVKVSSFIRDNLLFISMEEGDSAGCYYGRYISESEQDGYPYINEALTDWAKSNGGYFEWQDAGTIVFID
jgi:hypothetical protein